MFDILFARTFFIVGGMLLITTLTAFISKTFETAAEIIATIVGTFAFLFAALLFAHYYPANLILVAIFSAFVGWQIGPTIEFFGKRFKRTKYLKSRGITLKKGESLTDEQEKEFEQSFDAKNYSREWHNVVFQSLFATSCAVFAAAGIVFLTRMDFTFLGSFFAHRFVPIDCFGGFEYFPFPLISFLTC